MLLGYFLNDFEMVPLAPIITGITFSFTCHMRSISTVRSLYCKVSWASCLMTFILLDLIIIIIIMFRRCIHCA
jgi:hypothetical protein